MRVEVHRNRGRLKLATKEQASSLETKRGDDLSCKPCWQARRACSRDRIALGSRRNILGSQIHTSIGNDAPEHGVREARSALRAGAHELHALAHRRPGLSAQIDDLERRDAKRLANASVHTAGLLTVGIDKLVEAAIGCHHTEHKAGRKAGVSAAQLTQLRRGVEAIAGLGSRFLKIRQDIGGNPTRG